MNLSCNAILVSPAVRAALDHCDVPLFIGDRRLPRPAAPRPKAIPALRPSEHFSRITFCIVAAICSLKILTYYLLCIGSIGWLAADTGYYMIVYVLVSLAITHGFTPRRPRTLGTPSFSEAVLFAVALDEVSKEYCLSRGIIN